MKSIYIVLTHTGTVLSRIIKNYTQDEFSHVSISLDKELKEMYSFGRLNPYNPFWGGFVQEGINFGTFKRFRKTVCKIYSLKITEEQYNNVRGMIEYIKSSKQLHKFNVIGLFAVGFNKRISFENSFYCAEFVKYVLDKSEIENNLPEMIKPEDFKKMQGLNEIYEGPLRKYQTTKNSIVEKINETILTYSQREGIIWAEKRR